MAAFGTPLRRSTHRRIRTDTGQPAWVRKTSVSVEIGVRNCRIAALSSPGTSESVGRSAPLAATSGRMAVKVRKMTLLLLGFGAMKKGRASADADSSYWAAIDVTFREEGVSL